MPQVSTGIATTAGETAHVRILATSDLHMTLLPWDYFTDTEDPPIGLARCATLVRRARSGAPNAFLFDNGDFLQGNPMSDFLAELAEAGRPMANPMIGAMNLLGYDAVTLGNHEFNYGIDYLEAALGQANFPAVSANVVRRLGNQPESDDPLVPPFVVIDREIVTGNGMRRPLKVGVIGFAPPQIALWDGQHLGNSIATRDIVEAAQAHLPRLKAAGAEIVVALSHSGIGSADYEPGRENASVPLAAQEGIDALICGHTHRIFPRPGGPRHGPVDHDAGTIHGRPAAMPGAFGSHLAVIDLALVRRSGRWSVVRHASRLFPLRGIDGSLPEPDPYITKLAAPAHHATQEEVRRPIGRLEGRLQSYFALAAPDPCLTLATDAMRDTAERLLADLPEQGLPILCAHSPMRSGGHKGPGNYVDIPEGPLALRHAAELYAYPNRMVVVEMTGRDVARWLERSASIFTQLRMGESNQPLIDADCPPYIFDVLDGLTYEIDPTRPPMCDAAGMLLTPSAHRVSHIRLADGTEVTPEMRLVVATNSYRIGGSAGFGMVRQGRVLAESRQSLRDIIADYVRLGSPVHSVARRVWRFTSLPRTRAIFQTAPAAVEVLKGPDAPSHIRSLGLVRNGFGLYEVRF
ncbi:bifunctional 2',3'-cyclic-nucleotide 2'-phosphodiesterase/3'-nucleotidase [Pseudoroseicyclus sp. CXY001]|uniref:bifunctional 2',3'-cyclic-nucleotide 2'-phosphodiesterase/3'-nucleotidase n=1 Tax=Pseudoroseicyclus sp. CXY001 TaxID=3242492 RepID=UPI003570B3F3